MGGPLNFMDQLEPNLLFLLVSVVVFWDFFGGSFGISLLAEMLISITIFTSGSPKTLQKQDVY